MQSMVYGFIVSLLCILLSTFATSDLQNLKSIDQFPPTQSIIRDTDIMILAFCWDGQTFIDECQKNRGLIKKILSKLLYKVKTQTRISGNDGAEVDQDQRIPPKSRREDPSGFYSNW